MKAAVVAEDEREAGRRALLNLGHTFGHALEAETGFGGDLLHGEAVSVGMVLAAELSSRLGRLDPAAARLLRDHLDHAGLPVSMTEIPGAPFPAARLIGHMAHDKKAEAGQLTFILLDAIGRATVERGVPLDASKPCCGPTARSETCAAPRDTSIDRCVRACHALLTLRGRNSEGSRLTSAGRAA